MRVLNNAAMWGSLAALLAAIGVVVPDKLVENIIELFAALCAIVGIVETMWHARQQTKQAKPEPHTTP